MSSAKDASLHAIQLLIAILLLALNIAMLTISWPSAMMTASTVIAAVNVSIVWFIRHFRKTQGSRMRKASHGGDQS